MKKDIIRTEHHLMLDFENYKELLNDLLEKNNNNEIHEIDNYFFDTNDCQLYQSNVMLRLRHEAQKHFTLSLITPLNANQFESLSISPYCSEDRNKLFETTGAKIENTSFESALLLKTGNQPVAFLGKMLTKRYIIQYFGALIKIDQNFFPNGYFDHEVSIGVFEEQREKEVRAIVYFLKNTYNLTRSQYNKYQRFVGSLGVLSQ